MRLADFDFELPPDRIAQTPARPRDSARLLAVGETLQDRIVRELPTLLRPGDILVANDTRVIPAQLEARRGEARIGITLDQPRADGSWHALARNARRIAPGDTLRFAGGLTAEVLTRDADGGVALRFDRGAEALGAALQEAGALALPPYIDRPSGPTEADRSDYQTVFAAQEGAVAAPTAGLHFTPALLAALDAAGVRRATITLHVGAGTFLPVRTEDVAQHRMHSERGEVTAETVRAIAAARAAGGRVLAIGTTSLRILEAATDAERVLRPFAGSTDLFILPGYAFRTVDLLLTNFHLPRSTLFMLVSRLRGPRAHARGLCPCHRDGVPFLLLWRRDAAGARVSFRWEAIAADGEARAGLLHTAHGAVETPVFMPVGTAATVKAMTADAVRATGARIVLGNTYHLMLRPGAERVASLGGLHRMMDWPGPILTDSGGFQVMSLAKLRQLDEDGVTFRSHLDGSPHRLTPERAMGIQHLLDATITMVLDECTPFPAAPEEALSSMERSMRWAARCRQAFVERAGYALFGIVQGSIYPDLRIASAAALRTMGFEGYAVGGLAVGEGQAAMFSVLDVTVPHLPADRPRYLMGVGTPDDIVGAVMRGIDMFDCVIPTRAGRTARAYTSRGVFNLRNARFADDAGALDPACSCPACTRHPAGYLHHLFRAGEMLGPMLLTWHNIQYYQDLMRGLRQAIAGQRLADHAEQVRSGWKLREP